MKKENLATRLNNSKSITGNYLFFCDVETTGLDPIRNDVITGTIIATNKKLEKLDEISFKCRPDFNKFYSEKAEEIHGISRDRMSKFPRRLETCIDIMNFLRPFLGRGKNPFIYHANGAFDWNFLSWAFRKEDIGYSLYNIFDERLLISTIELGKIYKRKHKIPLNTRNDLKSWSELIKFDLKHHDAKSDTNACFELYKYLVNDLDFLL